jgi:tetratricopeptide (TPR) repeat protein
LRPVPEAERLSRQLREILQETMPGAPDRQRPCIAVVLDGGAGRGGLDRILDRLAVSVADVTGATLVDRRPNRAARPGPMPAALTAAVPDAVLRLVARDEGHGSLHLRMTLDTAEDGQRLCAHAGEIPFAPGRPDGGSDGLQVDAFIAHCSDLAALSIDRLPAGRTSPRATATEAMRQMFRLEPGALDEADRLVRAGQMAGGSAEFDSLAAYLETVRLGEDPVEGEPDDAQIEAALRACRSVETGAASGLSVTLAGYALDFLAADTSRAGVLMQRAAVTHPGLALAWDHLGMLNFRRRAYDEALACARRAVVLGASSPLLHIYETSLCMIQLARRKDHEAAHYGLRAVERNPRFSAALSYTAASLGLLGREERAREVLEKLRSIDPDVSLARIADRELIRIDASATSRLVEGLRRAGLE